MNRITAQASLPWASDIREVNAGCSAATRAKYSPVVSLTNGRATNRTGLITGPPRNHLSFRDKAGSGIDPNECATRPEYSILEALSKSRIYRDYEHAFTQGTGLPLSLHKPGNLRAIRRSQPHESSFSVLMGNTNQWCTQCYILECKLEQKAQLTAKTLKCFAGLCSTAIPVRVGATLIAFLRTGQILFQRPDKVQFDKIALSLTSWNSDVDLKRLEKAYYSTRVLSPNQYNPLIQLLVLFAQHLSLVLDRIMIQQDNAESPPIKRAKEFIEENTTEDISLRDVAKFVNVSRFYFCKIFKKSTGLTFTDYLSHVRISKAKNLLLNPNLRISEIAYTVGYQTLTHFNRSFLRIAGQSPSQYRESILVRF